MLALKMICFGKPNAWKPRLLLVAFRSLAMQASIIDVCVESGTGVLYLLRPVLLVERGRPAGARFSGPERNEVLHNHPRTQ